MIEAGSKRVFPTSQPMLEDTRSRVALYLNGSSIRWFSIIIVRPTTQQFAKPGGWQARKICARP